MAHDVFISYSSKDKPAADAACAALESRGVRCWIAPRDIMPGNDWGETIVEAIHGSRAFLLIFSGNANTSQQIKREVERAVNTGLPVIPMRIENVLPAKSLEYFLSTPHWLDAFAPPLQQHLNYLADIIRSVLDGKKAPEPPRPEPQPFYMDRRVMIGGGAGAVALIGLLFWMFGGPPTFVGKWTAQKIALDGSRLGSDYFQYIGSNFAKSAVAGNAITATFQTGDVGEYTLDITAEDHGIVALTDKTITFTSDLDHASLTTGYFFLGPQNAVSMVGAYGGHSGDDGLTMDPPLPLTQTTYVGTPDPKASGPTAKIAATWHFRNALGIASDNTLVITADGHYRYSLSVKERGVWQAADGKWSRTPQNGIQLAGTYKFDGSSRVTVAGSKDTFVWKRN